MKTKTMPVVYEVPALPPKVSEYFYSIPGSNNIYKI